MEYEEYKIARDKKIKEMWRTGEPIKSIVGAFAIDESLIKKICAGEKRLQFGITKSIRKTRTTSYVT